MTQQFQGRPPYGGPPQYRPPQGQQPPSRTGRGPWIWIIVALAAILAGLIVVAVVLELRDRDGGEDPPKPGGSASPGASPSPSPAPGAPTGGDVVLPIQWQFNSWLSDEYANGIGAPWTADGMVAGTSVDRRYVALAQHWDDALGGPVTTIHDVTSGEAVHRHEGLDCWGVPPAIDGRITCKGAVEEIVAQDGVPTLVTPIGTLDIATGAFEVFYNAPFTVHEVAVFAGRDGLRYAWTSSELGEVILVFGPGQTIVWQVTLPGVWSWHDCLLLGDHVGCEGTGTFTVLDAATGEVALSGPIPDGQYVTFSDGGVVVAEFFADEYTVQLFDGGEEVHREVPFGLHARPSAFLPVEALFESGGAADVDASGRAVLTYGLFGPTFVSSGQALPSQYQSAQIFPSETGRAFFAASYLTPEDTGVIDDRGELIVPMSGETRLEDGILVEYDPLEIRTTVLPPA